MIEVSGKCPGMIAFEPKGEGGFGYDPVFWCPDEGMTFAQLSSERKNEISHRAVALKAFVAKMEEMLHAQQ